MDHHCVWLGTCIGFHNCKRAFIIHADEDKPFLLFITYGSGLAIYAAIETIIETYRIAGSGIIQVSSLFARYG